MVSWCLHLCGFQLQNFAEIKTTNLILLWLSSNESLMQQIANNKHCNDTKGFAHDVKISNLLSITCQSQPLENIVHVQKFDFVNHFFEVG